MARATAATDGGYTEHRIGTTDDLQDADGVAVLDYGQAQKAARAWWRAELRREEGHDTRSGPFTVADAMADYLKASSGAAASPSMTRAGPPRPHPAGARPTLVAQADGKENRGLAPRPCRKASARPHQAGPEAEPPQS